MKKNNIVGDTNIKKLNEFFGFYNGGEIPNQILNDFDTDFRGEILDIIDLRDELIIRTTTYYYITINDRTAIATICFSSYKMALSFFLSQTHYHAITILSNN